MKNAIRVSMLSALAMIASVTAFAGQNDVKPEKSATSISSGQCSLKNSSMSTVQPTGFDVSYLSLPPGCRKVVMIDYDCFQQCIAEAEFTRKTCRLACTTETIECDTFPPVR